MERPSISVVIPTYNRAGLVPRAIQSALAQVNATDEVLVVDDASTDNTREVVARFGERVRFVAAPHGGAGATRNRGVAEARRELVAFLDSDDEWLPGHLDLHRRLHAARPDLAFSFSNFKSQSHGQTDSGFLRTWQADPRSWEELIAPPIALANVLGPDAPFPEASTYIGSVYLSEMVADMTPTFTVVARRNCLPDSDWFADYVAFHEDWAAFGRLAACGPAAFVDVDTAIQHGHALGRLTQTHDLRKIHGRLSVLQRVWGADPGFVRAHGDAYAAQLRRWRLALIRFLLTLGQTRQARDEIRRTPRTPLRYRMFARLPAPLARGVVTSWRKLRGRETENADVPS